jgi:hypothetical protein
MKQFTNWFFPIILGLAVVFTACDKNDENNDPPVDNPDLVSGTITIDATAYGEWVYFSFEEEGVVEVDDFLTSMDWDMGFHRFDIRTNCGTSGPGEGGTFDAGQVEFSSVTEAPENGYSLNDSIQVIMEQGVWEYQTVPGDTVLANWLSFSGPPPTYNISNHIYVLKTAFGKYAKIWLKDYYNDLSETGYVTMEYVYQPDGSRSFE